VSARACGTHRSIKAIDARLLISAASATQFPATGIPEIALVGRSNVGKSTLINTLVKQKIARTSSAPGKTRLANYYLIEGRQPGLAAIYLVDLPGYGYARGGSDSVEEFEALTQQYFDPLVQPGRRLAGVLHMVDARHPNLPQDAAAHRWILGRGVPIAVVATKIDKLKQSERVQALRSLRTTFDSPVVAESAVDGTGIEVIWKTILGWATNMPA
jgi:GTP-binding protein